MERAPNIMPLKVKELQTGKSSRRQSNPPWRHSRANLLTNMHVLPRNKRLQQLPEDSQHNSNPQQRQLTIHRLSLPQDQTLLFYGYNFH